MNRTERSTGPSPFEAERVLSRRAGARAAVGLACGAALALASASPGQEPPPVFPSAVETVRVDVVVTDGDGRPVTGLGRENFVVREDGVPQAIVDFEAIGDVRPAAARAAAAAPEAPAAPPPVAAVELPASFLIVFDEPHLTPEQARTARAFVLELLKRVRAGDRVTLVAGQDGRCWSVDGPEGARDVARLIEGASGRRARASELEAMTPYEAMRIVQGDRRVEQIVRSRLDARGGGLDVAPSGSRAYSSDPQVQMRARAVYDEALQHVRRLLALAAQTLELVARQRGRTTLVLASGGFVDDALLGEYRELVRRCVRTGVTAYFYDARDMSIGGGHGADAAGRMPGARGRLDLDHERRRDEDQRLRAEALDGDASGATRLADDTGGFTIRVSDTTGLDRLETDARHYYLVGYVPTNTKRDGGLRRIAVAVNAPGVSVRARKAYYAPNDKEQRLAARTAPPTGSRTTAPSRDEAASRYRALVDEHRTTPRAEALDAVTRWSPDELRRTASAVAAEPGAPRERRWAAVLLHTDAAIRADAQGAVDAARVQRALARELVAGGRGGRDDADFERLWFHAMGDLELERARVKEAVELFDALVERYPREAESHLALGRAHELGLYLLSLIVRQSLAEQPDLTSEGFDMFRYQRSRGGGPVATAEESHRRSALESYRAALRLEPALLEARLRLGRVLWLDGKLDEAVRELKAVADGPSADGRQLACLFLSRVEDERGRPEAALAHARAAVEARPQWQSGRLALADLLRRAGEPEQATRTALAALSPEGPASPDGWLRYNLGAHDRAALVLQAMRAMVRP